jgi:hypothetical protein
MLFSMLLEELAIPAFGDYFHRIILSNRLVEYVPKHLADDRAPWQMRSAYATMDVAEQLNALFPWYVLHHHAIDALME